MKIVFYEDLKNNLAKTFGDIIFIGLELVTLFKARSNLFRVPGIGPI